MVVGEKVARDGDCRKDSGDCRTAVVAGEGDCRTVVIAGQRWLQERWLQGMVTAGRWWLQDSCGCRNKGSGDGDCRTAVVAGRWLKWW